MDRFSVGLARRPRLKPIPVSVPLSRVSSATSVGSGKGLGLGGQAAREAEVRQAHVEPRPHREAVGELVGDRGVDRPGRDLALEADVAAGEGVGVVPLRPDPERPAHAQADHRLLAHLLRVVERGQDAQADVRLLERARGRVRPRPGEVGREPREGAAHVELLALQEADAGRVVEDGGRVGGLGDVGAGEAHRPGALALDGEARRVGGGGKARSGSARSARSTRPRTTRLIEPPAAPRGTVCRLPRDPVLRSPGSTALGRRRSAPTVRPRV